MSRVYFRLGEHEKALAVVNDVIEKADALYALDQDPIEAWNRSNASKGNEVIWQAIYYDEQLGASPKDATLFTFMDYRATNGGHGDYFKRSTWHLFSMSNNTAQKLGWMNEELEETEVATRDKRYQQLYHRLEGHRGSFADDPDVYEQQYFNVTEPRIWGDKYFRAPDGQYSNTPIIRLAEMYLTRAIIRFKDGDKQGAADDMNIVRKRAWDESVAEVLYEDSDDYLTADNITEEDIHLERLKELGFEGDRLLYLQALRLPVEPGDREGVQPIEFPYENLYWPVPQSELDFRTE